MHEISKEYVIYERFVSQITVLRHSRSVAKPLAVHQLSYTLHNTTGRKELMEAVTAVSSIGVELYFCIMHLVRIMLTDSDKVARLNSLPGHKEFKKRNWDNSSPPS
jgi:hypothetical protein